MKDNFLAGRIFWNVTGLNYAALEWCAEQNTAYHRGLGVPQDEHTSRCADVVTKLDDSMELLFYLCPERRISFDGFVNYEGHRFGVLTPIPARRLVLCVTLTSCISTLRI